MMTTEIKKMNRETVKTIINGIKEGTFTRVTYCSTPSLTAESKKNGVKVTKVTETTVRVGIDYENVKATKEYKAEHTVEQRDFSSWENDEEGRIVFVPKTGNTLVRVYKVPQNSNTKSYFIIEDKDGKRAVERLSDSDKALFVPSYFKEKSGDALKDAWAEVTQKINIDNFLAIGDVKA